MAGIDKDKIEEQFEKARNQVLDLLEATSRLTPRFQDYVQFGQVQDSIKTMYQITTSIKNITSSLMTIEQARLLAKTEDPHTQLIAAIQEHKKEIDDLEETEL